jgi:hypothetical protein
MIDDETHPEMRRALLGVGQRIDKIVQGRPITKPLIDEVMDAIKHHRNEWRTRGVDFPTLVLICIPRLGVLEFARADLDIASIRIKIVNVVRMNPAATKIEVVDAFCAAYPDLKPGDVIQGHTSGKAADERQRERQARIQKEVNEQLDIPEDKPLGEPN